MFLQPLDELYDAMLATDASKHSLPTMFGKKVPKNIEFFFTRDYLQRSILVNNPQRFGVQGGFFITKPNLDLFQQLVDNVMEGNYERGKGWGLKGYGGYWGAAQIQGFLSYFFTEIRPEGAVELNRCIYNSMIDDEPMYNGKCRTAERTCEDCRERPLAEIKTVHLTTCWKPWHCPTLRYPHPERCKEVHRAWFDFRQALELSWGYEVPQDGWWFKRTLGYCTKAGGKKKRYYLQLKLPNETKDITLS
mmetsp:Transcript_24937/g.42449  ORF Transcript_24937/g.42449 Transcript_24937/m.42449 type:complete len:248 (+) Transcript_24937:1-744(+)